jgi:hypothetical protein
MIDKSLWIQKIKNKEYLKLNNKEKLTKDLYANFTNEDSQVGNKHEKIHLTSYACRIGNLNWQSSPWPKSKTLEIADADEDVDQ